MPSKQLKPLEDIVREVGRYPFEAYLFVQEAIGLAAEKVHGPMSTDQRVVATWMSKNDITPEDLLQRFDTGNLPEEIVEAVDRLGGATNLNRHVTGQELCWGIRDIALERWGLMARGVLARWNIHSTEDLGAIVFALVENQWLAKQPTDRIEDFRNVYHFVEVFDRQYQIGR
ncbi:MAG TPA: Minf_1886 family protein [Phycisphaerae bacterium]|nr:Minf_1886 family protein [Phycisphaerae bacterium]